jgi:serine/threonine protein kinase
MTQAAEALWTVHEAGYIHRDICPRNFVCSKDGASLKLIDFGLTVPARREFQQPGIRTGTPNYMAPEVVRRKPTDQRLDIFSYGVSMYEMFAFELPWTRGSDGMAAMSHGQSSPASVDKFYPKIHPRIRDLIHKCIEPDPENRIQSMKLVLNTLRGLKHEDVK